MRRSPVVLLLGLSLGVGVLPAAAATSEHPRLPAAAKAKAARLTVQGLVVSHSARTVTVLVRTGSVGRRSLAHRVLTLPLPTARSAKPAPASGRDAFSATENVTDGDDITYKGTQSGQGVAPLAVSVSPAPAMALLGFTNGIDSQGNLRVRALHTEDGHHGGDDGKATQVNTSAASVTLDGQPAALTDLPAHALVVVLGERDDDVVTAASVTAYSQIPPFAAGTVTAATATTLTVSSEKGEHGRNGQDGARRRSQRENDQADDNAGDATDGSHGTGGEGGDDDSGDQPATNVVDVTTALVFLDGAASTASGLGVGNHAVAIGTSNPDGTLTASLVLAFDSLDKGPASRGGRDDGGGGDGGGDGEGHHNSGPDGRG